MGLICRSHLALAHYRESRPDVYSGPGLLPSNGPAWESLRRRFQFRPAAVDAALPSIDALAKQLAELVRSSGGGGNSADGDGIMTCLKRYFFEATNAFLFGSAFEGLAEARPSREMVRLFEAAVKTNSNVLKTDNGLQLWKHFETPPYRFE